MEANKKKITDHMQDLGALIALVLLIVGIGIVSPEFRTWSNFLSLLRQSSINGLIAFGMTCVILTDAIDLSVGSVLALSTALCAGMISNGVPAGAAMLAALVIGAVAGFLKRQDRKMRTIMSWAAGAGAFFLVSSWVVTHFFSNGTGVIAMCILVPIVVVLALVYLLYQHECALSTVMLSGAMFSVWLRSASANSSIWRLPVMIGCIAAAAVVVAVLFLVFRVQKDGGKLLGVQVFSSECDYRVLYGVLGIAAAALLLAAAVSVTAYYLLWALAVLLFAELVFYTTKLM